MVAVSVAAAQGADIEGKLVAEDQMKDWHRLTLLLPSRYGQHLSLDHPSCDKVSPRREMAMKRC
jgi:hypothetical protein